jgi:methionyl-tRNA formyltransferase
VVFVGSKRMGLRSLEAMHAAAPGALAGVITLDDRADTRQAFDAFGAFASRTGVPLHVAADRKHFDRLIQELAPELVVVVGWFWLIGEQVLARVPGGFWAIHNSLLPRYRGGAPLVWALINGEKEVGISLFQLTAGMDEGDVLGQRATTVGPLEGIGDVLARLEDAAVELVAATYPQLLAGTARATPQDHRLATFAALRVAGDGGIDWTRPARAVHDFIRAQSDPYPGAFTLLDGQPLRIWRARPLDVTYHGTPGQVAWRGPEGVTVVCGDQRALLVEEAQLGEVRGPAAELVRSLQVRFPRQAPT